MLTVVQDIRTRGLASHGDGGAGGDDRGGDDHAMVDRPAEFVTLDGWENGGIS